MYNLYFIQHVIYIELENPEIDDGTHEHIEPMICKDSTDTL
jgi:hypothetical protein